MTNDDYAKFKTQNWTLLITIRAALTTSSGRIIFKQSILP
jgi:hypothetical protein